MLDASYPRSPIREAGIPGGALEHHGSPRCWMDVGSVSRDVRTLAMLTVLSGVIPGGPAVCETTPAGELTRALAQAGTLHAARRGVPVRGHVVTIGRLTLRLEEGRMFPVVDAARAVRGFMFEGRGEYRYLSTDRIDRNGLAYNLGRRNRRLLLPDGSIGEAFERVVVQGVRPVGAGEAGRHTEELSAASLEAFQRLWKYAPEDGLHRVAQMMLQDHGGYAFVALQGGGKVARYIYDEVQVFREALTLHRDGAGGDPGRLVSLQALSGIAPEVRTPLVLTRAALNVRTADNRSGTVSGVLTCRVDLEGLRIAAFWVSNQRSPQVLDGVSDRPGPYRVTRVEDGSGRPLSFHHLGGQMLVDLGRPHRRGEVVRMAFEISGELFRSLRGVNRSGYFELMSANWHPRPIGEAASRFAYDLRVRTRKPFLPIAPGRQVFLREDGQYNELRVVCDGPVPYTAVFAGRYRAHESAPQGLPVRVYAHGHGDRRAAGRLAELAARHVRFFESLLGPYPYPRLDIVEVPEPGDFGIAGPGIVVLSSGSFRAARGATANANPVPVEHRLAHEIAHQWMGNKAIIASARDRFLSESFAEYLAALAIARTPPARGADRMARTVARWRRGALVHAEGSIVAADQLGGRFDEDLGKVLLYNRGPLVLRMLHGVVGEATFAEMLRELMLASEQRPLSLEMFEQALACVTGEDWDGFVDQWIGRGGIPSIDVEHRVDRSDGGKFRLSGVLRQPAGEGFKVVHVPLVLQMPGGSRRLATVVQKHPTTAFDLELDQRPTRVLIDPADITLARYSH